MPVVTTKFTAEGGSIAPGNVGLITCGTLRWSGSPRGQDLMDPKPLSHAPKVLPRPDSAQVTRCHALSGEHGPYPPSGFQLLASADNELKMGATI